MAYALSAVELRRELGRARRAHSNRTFWDAAQDAYIAAFTAVIITSMVVSAFIDIAGRLTSCTSGDCHVARGPVPILMLITVAGVSIRALSAVGPVAASRAVATWLLATPTNRRGLLRRPFLLAVLVSVGVSVLFLGVAGVTAGADAVGVLTAVVVGSATGAVAVASTTLTQPHPHARRVLVVSADLVLLAGFAILALVALGYSVIETSGFIEASWVVDASWLDARLVLAVAGLSLVIAIVLLVQAWRRLGALGLPEIVAGGELLTGLAGAAYGLDLALIGEIVAARKFRMMGARPSRRGRTSSAAALVERELLRLIRSPGRFVGYLALGLVPALFDRAGLAPVAPMVAGLAGYLAVRWSASGLRRVWRSAGLRRALPFDLPVLLLCFGLPSALLSLVWASGVAFAITGPWLASVVTVALSVLAGVVRSAAAPPPNYGGVLVTSPMGALPPGMFTMVIRGPDAALVGTVALAAGASPLWSVCVPVVLLVIVCVRAISVARGRPSMFARDETQQ